MIDASGDIRWYLDPRTLWKPESMDSAGVMMGFCQNPGRHHDLGGSVSATCALTSWAGIFFNRRLPAGYNDFSHAMDPMPNGHYLLRVASSDLRRADGKRIRTVRDVIIEVESGGFVVDEWRLFVILDPYRATDLKGAGRRRVP